MKDSKQEVLKENKSSNTLANNCNTNTSIDKQIRNNNKSFIPDFEDDLSKSVSNKANSSCVELNKENSNDNININTSNTNTVTALKDLKNEYCMNNIGINYMNNLSYINSYSVGNLNYENSAQEIANSFKEKKLMNYLNTANNQIQSSKYNNNYNNVNNDIDRVNDSKENSNKNSGNDKASIKLVSSNKESNLTGTFSFYNTNNNANTTNTNLNKSNHNNNNNSNFLNSLISDTNTNSNSLNSNNNIVKENVLNNNPNNSKERQFQLFSEDNLETIERKEKRNAPIISNNTIFINNISSNRKINNINSTNTVLRNYNSNKDLSVLNNTFIKEEPSFFMKKLNAVSKLLQLAEGKNKLSSLFQYSCKFISSAIIYSIDSTALLENSQNMQAIYKKHLTSKTIEKSISNARKIFRFLKFIEDIKKSITYIQSKKFNYKSIINSIIYILSSFYHFLDNLVLLTNLGVLNSTFIEGFNWKTGKNFFSLLKSSFKLFIYLLEWSELMKTTWKENDDFSDENINTLLCNSNKINDLYYLMLEAIMKILMRINSLKLEPIFSYLNPLLTSLFGIISSVCGLIKRFEKVQKEEKEKAEGFIKQIHIENTLHRSNVNLRNINHKKSAEEIVLKHDSFKNSLLPNSRQSFNYLLTVKGNNDNDKHLLSDVYYKSYYLEFSCNYPNHPDFMFDGI